MKRVAIVSTYPETGSKNIGDQLITASLIGAISDIVEGVSFEVVPRMYDWARAKSAILASDHVIFACLAIRPEMDRNEYPSLGEILSSGVPFSAISAGTSLPVDGYRENLFKGFRPETLSLLEEFNQKATVFTTRGVLSQRFCQYYGLDNAIFTGDIAFFDSRFDSRAFVAGREIRRITISDPHRFRAYESVLERLLYLLRRLFPEAEILMVQHGTGAEFRALAFKHDLELAEIYKTPEYGLDVYDDADIHVGFRVHAHVSMLKRRRYSYLLEQDGRGYEYGLTLNRKISVPTLANGRVILSGRNIAKYLRFGRRRLDRWPHTVAADQLLAMIEEDSKRGFEKFVGLESQIKMFNDLLARALRRAF